MDSVYLGYAARLEELFYSPLLIFNGPSCPDAM